MKQMIVMIATVILGLSIFQLVCGKQEGSVLNAMKDAWQQEIEVRTHETL